MRRDSRARFGIGSRGYTRIVMGIERFHSTYRAEKGQLSNEQSGIAKEQPPATELAKPTPTDAGAPAASDEHSLTIGAEGPIVRNDHYLIEQMANFYRERVSEGRLHAKGGGAFGHFQATQEVSRCTRAAVFQPGIRTKILIRFSTVAGERGNPDTWRDLRGFVLKFYTSEGIYDMRGNNTPVFCIREPLNVQHFIRPQKRRADSGLRDDDMQCDFWTLWPESAHQVTRLMGDRGIPKSLRHMNGYSSLTHMRVNAEGENFWVKYHFETDQGVDCLRRAEADLLDGADSDCHQRDLFSSIRRGDFPCCTLKMQIMPFEEAKTYRFNPFDLIKVWPHKDYALVEVGKLTLDRNVTDFHTEIEQAAFEPDDLLPGIGLSPEKMLLARGFCHSDAQRARLGVNYKQIPVNRPKSALHSYSRDGAMRVQNVSDPVYAPNPCGAPRPIPRAPTRRDFGTSTAAWCARRTPYALRTTTLVKREPWCVVYWMNRRAHAL